METKLDQVNEDVFTGQIHYKGPTLYKRGVKGEVRCWRMEFIQEFDDEKQEQGRHRVVTGILDGAETPSGWTIGEPKNVGKKNETTSVTQARSEIDNQYKIKRERGYFDDIEKIDEVVFTKPMLAADYTKRKGKFDLDDVQIAQPKLDGIRCIARADGLWTRTGKPITSLPHIVEALAPIFEQYPDWILDGELYNHELREDFNTITSVVRKAKPTPEDMEKARDLIQYHIYDIIAPEDPVMRCAALGVLLTETIGQDLYQLACDPQGPLRKVESLVVGDQEGLDRLYGRWIEEGYEGQMIRLAGPYEHKRSNLLLKRKEFITDEFAVIRVEEGKGNWAGCVKRFVFELEDGRECGAGVRGTQETLAALLESGRVPDWCTVRYFTPTPDGMPRFPVVVDWGFGERDD